MLTQEMLFKIKTWIIPNKKYKYSAFDKCGSFYMFTSKPKPNLQYQTWQVKSKSGKYQIITAECQWLDIQNWIDTLKVLDSEDINILQKLQKNDNIEVLIANGQIGMIQKNSLYSHSTGNYVRILNLSLNRQSELFHCLTGSRGSDINYTLYPYWKILGIL